MAHSDHRLPPWVDEAARRFERRGTPEIVDDWPKPPRIGDVRLAEPLDPARGEQRLVVVLDTDSQVASVRVALASNELQWRSEEGLVLSSASTDLPFDLLIEPDVTGELWWVQVGRRVAGIGDEWIDRLADLTRRGDRESRAEEDSSVDQDSSAFQRRELEALGRLTSTGAAANREIGLDSVPVVVDPFLLVQWQGEPSRVYLRRLLAVIRAIGGAERVVVPGGFDLGQDRADTDSGLTGDLDRALDSIRRRKLDAPAPAAPAGIFLEHRKARAGNRSERELANELCRLARDGRGVARLLTSAAAWNEPESLRRPTVLDVAGCGRLHVIHHDLEALL